MNKKLYVVKNDEGKYWDFDNSGFWRPEIADCLTTPSKKQAELLVFANGGRVVTLIEEPEKVVLTKEKSEIVENARDEEFPATYISDSANLAVSGEEELLMKAYVNGYTVTKEKKYNVKVPHTYLYYWKKLDGGLSINGLSANNEYDALKFTEEEIEYYGLQDCEKEEVTDDEFY